MRFGTWNIRSLCRVGAIMLVVEVLVGVQELSWEGEEYQTAENYTLFYGKVMLIN
jgi:hypothetical protein